MSSAESGLRFENFGITVAGRPLVERYSESFDATGLTVIVGPSGAGKSLWLRAVAGFTDDSSVVQTTGSIRRGELADARIAVVFQDHALLDELSAEQNVQIAIDHRRGGIDSRTATDWMGELGVPHGVPVTALSGGQKQRLGIARALASSPDFVLYDEPTSGLDGGTAKRVAALIRDTHIAAGIPGVIVTHDYASVIPIADDVRMLDPAARTIIKMDRQDWAHIAARFESPTPAIVASGATPGSLDRLLTRLGRVVRFAALVPWMIVCSIPTTRWSWRFFWDKLKMVGGPSAIVYVATAGAIAGFVTTYFTLDFLPYKRTTGPLLVDDLIAMIGFALYRVLIPILATLLVAARNGAALAAITGVRRYGKQLDAMRMMGVDPHRHLAGSMMAAMIITTPLLVFLSYLAARLSASLTFAAMYPHIEPIFWQQHFGRLSDDNHATAWVIAKSLVSGIGIAAIAYRHGNAVKTSAADINRGITGTILWATLFVLVTHFVVALLEF